MPTVQARALRRAAELLGGPDLLARNLGVPRTRLDSWMSGVFSTPPEVFLTIVDILIAHGLTEAQREARRRRSPSTGGDTTDREAV
jgi:hypothetical protein